MEIKTTKSIQFSGARDTRWVAVDEIIKEINRCLSIPDEHEMFKQFKLLTNSLSTFPSRNFTLGAIATKSK